MGVNKHKRKGSDPLLVGTAVVSSSARYDNNDHNNSNVNSSSSSSWFDETTQRLQQLLLQLEKDDDDEAEIVVSGMMMNQCSLAQPGDNSDILGDADKNLTQVAHACKSRLQQRLAEEQLALQKDSEELYQQQLLVHQLSNDRDQWIEDIAQLEEEARSMRNKSHQYQQTLQQAQLDIDRIEIEERIQLPRLQHEISLYASATGLKWDAAADDDSNNTNIELKTLRTKTTTTNHPASSATNSQQNLLTGEVAVPSRKQIRRFAFDLDTESNMEIANTLWRIMDGKRF